MPITFTPCLHWTPTSVWTGSTYVDLARPDPATLCLFDIARGLRKPRWNALSDELLTVAEHSIAVARVAVDMFPALDARALGIAALFHDAAESLLGDLVTPAKTLCPDYREAEGLLMSAIRLRFGLSYQFGLVIRAADAACAASERLALFTDTPPEWPGLAPPHPLGVFRSSDPVAAFIAEARQWGAA